MIGALASLTAAASVVAWGALERNAPLFGPVQRRLATRERLVALTFDDGPNPVATRAILDVLGAEGVPATFFALGRHAERWPSLVARAAGEGHAVGNHGYHHRKLLWKSPRYVRDDIRRGTQAITHAGAPAPRLFRAPHGQRNPWVTAFAGREGQRTVGWTLGVWDTDRPGARVIAERVIRGVARGSIVLLHDGDGYDPHGDRMQTAVALPLLIRGLRARGFDFVALSVP